MAEHTLKVQEPYFDALVSGAKNFEVRYNDRAYQVGDVLILEPWHGISYDSAKGTPIRRVVTFVYSGDPRFGRRDGSVGGVQSGYVVLGLGEI